MLRSLRKDLHAFPSKGFGELRKIGIQNSAPNTALLFLSASITQMCSSAEGREWWRRKKKKGGPCDAAETDEPVRRLGVHYQP